MVLPQLTAAEHVLQLRPIIPEVAGDPPHVGVFFVVPRLINQGRAWREGEHNRPVLLLDGAGQHLDLVLSLIRRFPGGADIVGVADIVAFDKVHAPGGVQLYERIIIRLACGAVPDTVHVRVPPADRGGVGGHISGDTAALDFHMLVGGNPGDAPHDVYAELQPQPVDVLRQRGKPPAPRRGGEPLRVWQQAGVFVYLYRGKGDVLKTVPHGAGFVGVPLDIHHNVLPAVFFQLFRHHPGVGADLLLVYSGVVVIIAVPSHGRGGGKAVFIHKGVLRSSYKTAGFRRPQNPLKPAAFQRFMKKQIRFLPQTPPRCTREAEPGSLPPWAQFSPWSPA